MSALAKSPVADALREAGLTEEQIAAALDAAAKQPVKSVMAELIAKARAMGLEAKEHMGSCGLAWLAVSVPEAGSLAYWPAHDGVEAHWLVTAQGDPDEAPSPMARAQRLYDLYRQLVAP